MTKYKEEEISPWCSLENPVPQLQAVLLAGCGWRTQPEAMGSW